MRYASITDFLTRRYVDFTAIEDRKRQCEVVQEIALVEILESGNERYW